MDNICHTLVGAALAEAGLKRRTRLAIATLMIGANLPDVDVLAIPLGESLTFRRGWTHGPLAWVVLPVLLTAAIVAWDRFARGRGGAAAREPVRPRQVLLLAFVGVLSHPFFDWLNTYGIRALMPFSEEWLYGDALFIVDPWIWLALGTGVFLSKRWAKAGRERWTRPARVALGGVALYVGAMVAASAAAERVAVREVEARTRVRPQRMMAGPVPADPFRRALVYDAGEAYGLGELTWTPAPRVRLHPELLPKRADHPAAREAARTEPFQDFLYWARFPYFRIEEEAAGAWVSVADARYASPGSDGWATERVWVPKPLATDPE